MKKACHTEEQITFALKQAETGAHVGEVCRKMGITFNDLWDHYSWACFRRFISRSTHFYIVRCNTASHFFLGQINVLLAKERLISSGYSRRLLTNKIKSHYKQRAMEKSGIKNNLNFSALIIYVTLSGS